MADTSRPDRAARAYAWRVLSVTSLGSTLSALNISALNVALPVVARHFRASAGEASWLLLTYMITTTVMMLSFGRLADIMGRRTLYIAGIACLTASSFACGLAPSVAFLEVFRVIQAISAAALITNTTAILTDAFPRDILPTGLSVQLTLVAAAQVAGPALGGFLAQEFGWRAVFWFNVPGGIVGTVWALTTLRRVPHKPVAERFDYLSSLLTLFILGGLVTALSEGVSEGFGRPVVVVSAALFVLATPVFVIRQRRVQAPLVDLRLFDNWGRASAYLTNLVLAAIRLGAVLLIGLYLQGTGTGGSSVAGLVVSSVAVGIVVTSPVSGWLTGRLPAQIVCTAGMAMTAVALGFLGLGLEPSTRPIVLAVVLFCLGVGAGLFMTPNTASIMTSVPADRRGIANAVRSTCQNTGYTLSTAVLLGVATYPLSTVERRLAYRGELSTLGPHAVSQFTAAMHLAFCGLAVLALVAALVSYSRGDRLTAAASMAVR